MGARMSDRTLTPVQANTPELAAGDGAVPAASWDINNDALAHALSWLSHHHGRPRSAESLLAGQPMQGRLTPEGALRVLHEAGFNAGLVQRDIGDINPLLLPAVLLLNGGDACIVLARQGHGADSDPDNRLYDVVMPGREHHACTATESELRAEYSGSALVCTPYAASAAHHRQDVPLLTEPGRHWLWGTMRRFLPYYRAALLAALLSNVLMLVTGMVTAVIYDKVIPHQAYVTLVTLAIGAALALAFDLMARQLRAYLIDMAGRKADLIVGSILFRQTLSLRMEQRPDSAGAYSHHLAQIEQVREFFASATLAAISDLPFIVVFVAMVFVIGGPLGWVLVVAIPLLLVMSLLIQGALRRATMAHMNQTADLHGVLVEAVDGLEDLKAAGAQGRFLRLYEEATASAAHAMLRSRKIMALTMNISALSQQAISLVMLVWGVFLIDAKVVSAGALIGSVMFASRAVAPLSSVVQLATRYQGARAALRALNRVMQQPVDREPGRAYVPRSSLNGQLALLDVTFAYPEPSDLRRSGAAVMQPAALGPQVLKGFNLRVEPRERIALLGRIGSGKSTVLRLMAGLYLPTGGQVQADGIDLRQIDPADYRARVGFVAQDPRLFKGTLRDNVLLDRPSADPARLGEVARVTGLDRLVAHHPLGWELPVGEGGALLSGGQRQLVALARCLITRPQLLLMDEPTSSMDAQSEVAFLRQLRAACGDCTLVMVTHRPAVLELVQRVVVVDQGRVVMDGAKDAVLAALSGSKPPTAAQGPASNLHLHPTAQPAAREAAV
jgi:ATP-binding cassette, subfamily C, bacterial LapB